VNIHGPVEKALEDGRRKNFAIGHYNQNVGLHIPKRLQKLRPAYGLGLHYLQATFLGPELDRRRLGSSGTSYRLIEPGHYQGNDMSGFQKSVQKRDGGTGRA
jgi:hypothetical protein